MTLINVTLSSMKRRQLDSLMEGPRMSMIGRRETMRLCEFEGAGTAFISRNLIITSIVWCVYTEVRGILQWCMTFILDKELHQIDGQLQGFGLLLDKFEMCGNNVFLLLPCSMGVHLFGRRPSSKLAHEDLCSHDDTIPEMPQHLVEYICVL